MKIALFSTSVPFVRGGYRNIVDWLEIKLREAGHQVETIYIPQVDDADTLWQQMAAFRWIDLSAADRVICFRPQAHLIQHPHKILWFIHHIRSYYDLWGTPLSGIDESEKQIGVRDALRSLDTRAIQESKKVFTNSIVVSDRLKKFNDIDSEVLYPPILAPERFVCREYGDEIVYICRMEPHKRQHLLLSAMKHTRSEVRLRFCGAGSSAYVNELRQFVERESLSAKVTITDEWITEEAKVELLSDCLAAAYLPVDEDSYGYPSLEASHARKSVLTTSDSGGVMELVENGVNGYVCDPTPESLADAMDRLFLDRPLAKQLGEKASERLDQLNISWTHVLNRLLA